jgi:CubicO group peptidase (beta-lactamase class C family)
MTGAVFERATKNNLFREFERIADPTAYRTKSRGQRYVTGPDSVYPAYPFRLTARDMARFGLLFVREGRGAGGRSSRQWVKDSVTPYSDTGASGGYGYMWWVAAKGRHVPGVAIPDGSYSARGAGGHYILVIPAYDLVIVHRVNTDIKGNSVSGEEFGKLVKLILDARMTQQGTHGHG